ncbi:unnamed protein product [Heligmosomoides polygyrus]|uniref:Uncharacterized protein n=1 Tax=Heligmosomoides polygyrus TaxID=6339 RepID=A0A3P7ZMZ4_HELPZ|nr:unnamed protein product [Heligmosomoides polygyrus]
MLRWREGGLDGFISKNYSPDLKEGAEKAAQAEQLLEVQIKALLSMNSYLRSLLLFILVGLSVALPMLWYDNEARENSEPQLMTRFRVNYVDDFQYLRNIGPLSLLKRNIAIGRGDGLRPGK